MIIIINLVKDSDSCIYKIISILDIFLWFFFMLDWKCHLNVILVQLIYLYRLDDCGTKI